jgi:hypothetical protein
VGLLVLGQTAGLIEERQRTKVPEQRLGLRLTRSALSGKALVELVAEIVGALLEVIEKSHAMKSTESRVAPVGATLAIGGRPR